MLRLAEKCAMDTCDKRWVAGIAFICNNQTYRFCSVEHQQPYLKRATPSLPWPRNLYGNNATIQELMEEP